MHLQSAAANNDNNNDNRSGCKHYHWHNPWLLCSSGPSFWSEQGIRPLRRQNFPHAMSVSTAKLLSDRLRKAHQRMAAASLEQHQQHSTKGPQPSAVAAVRSSTARLQRSRSNSDSATGRIGPLSASPRRGGRKLVILPGALDRDVPKQPRVTMGASSLALAEHTNSYMLSTLKSVHRSLRRLPQHIARSQDSKFADIDSVDDEVAAFRRRLQLEKLDRRMAVGSEVCWSIVEAALVRVLVSGACGGDQAVAPTAVGPPESTSSTSHHPWSDDAEDAWTCSASTTSSARTSPSSEVLAMDVGADRPDSLRSLPLPGNQQPRVARVSWADDPEALDRMHGHGSSVDGHDSFSAPVSGRAEPQLVPLPRQAIEDILGCDLSENPSEVGAEEEGSVYAGTSSGIYRKGFGLSYIVQPHKRSALAAVEPQQQHSTKLYHQPASSLHRHPPTFAPSPERAVDRPAGAVAAEKHPDESLLADVQWLSGSDASDGSTAVVAGGLERTSFASPVRNSSIVGDRNSPISAPPHSSTILLPTMSSMVLQGLAARLLQRFHLTSPVLAMRKRRSLEWLHRHMRHVLESLYVAIPSLETCSSSMYPSSGEMVRGALSAHYSLPSERDLAWYDFVTAVLHYAGRDPLSADFLEVLLLDDRVEPTADGTRGDVMPRYARHLSSLLQRWAMKHGRS